MLRERERERERERGIFVERETEGDGETRNGKHLLREKRRETEKQETDGRLLREKRRIKKREQAVNSLKTVFTFFK